MKLIDLGNYIKFYEAVSPHYVTLEPKKVYTLHFNEIRGEYYLTYADDLELEKMYGEDQFDKRVLHTFKESKGNITVGLVGVKGTGKTLTAKRLAINSNLPIILIKERFQGGGFVEFFKRLPSVCVLIDEFEKLYDTNIGTSSDEPEDTTLLQLFDGVYGTKHLFILTSNDQYLGDLFTDRLGRILFKKEFGYLDERQIQHVCNSELNDKSKIDSLLFFNCMYKKMTYDVLRKIISQLNLFGLSVAETVSDLNLSYEDLNGRLIKIIKDDKLTEKQMSQANAILEEKEFWEKPVINIDVRDYTVDVNPIFIETVNGFDERSTSCREGVINKLMAIKNGYEVHFTNLGKTHIIHMGVPKFVVQSKPVSAF